MGLGVDEVLELAEQVHNFIHGDVGAQRQLAQQTLQRGYDQGVKVLPACLDLLKQPPGRRDDSFTEDGLIDRVLLEEVHTGGKIPAQLFLHRAGLLCLKGGAEVSGQALKALLHTAQLQLILVLKIVIDDPLGDPLDSADGVH